MKIRKSPLPSESLIAGFLPVDYQNTFILEEPAACKLSPDDILINIWTDMPAWVEALFRIRNLMVRFVGLKGSKGAISSGELERCLREGGKCKVAEVPLKNDTETVMKLSDKHLDAYLSAQIIDGHGVALNTLVKFHNNLGRAYFFLIWPFHKIVVKSTLIRSVRRLLSK